MKNKKRIALITAIALIACVVITTPTVTAAEPQLGDVNHDDMLAASDARSVLRAAVGLESYDETFFVYADVNKSNVIESSDARAILRAAVGLEPITCTTTIEDVMSAQSQQELNRHAFRTAIVEDNYAGTMEEWLDSLKGKDGLSAYEIAVKLGFEGTESEWLASLKGEPGEKGEDGTDGITPHIGANGNWWIGETDTGIKAAGTNGTNGANGENGTDGVSVVDSYVDESYHLWIVLSDGNKIDAGYVGVQVPATPTEPSEPSTNPTAPSDPSTEPTEPSQPSTEPSTDPVVNGPTVTISNAVVSAGETSVAVTLNMTNNPGILGMTLELAYDESAMSLVAIEKGSALSEMTFTTPRNLSSGCKLPWDAEEVLPEDATNGLMLTLYFNISDFTAAGNYTIALTYDNGAVIDNDLNSVDLAIVNGTITIK